MASDNFAMMCICRDGFQKIADGHTLQTLVPPLGLESENIFFLYLHLCRVFDPHVTFVVRVEASQALCIFRVW